MSLKIGPKQTPAHIDTLYIGKTYAGLLIGTPSQGMNDGILQGFPQRAVATVGCGLFREPRSKAQPVVIAPERKPLGTAGPFGPEEYLPDYYIFALIDGPNTDKESAAASALVIFFIDELSQSIEEMVSDACKNEDWEQMAYNFDY